ncbi:hypothetical protein N7468_005120 [Penicillium chermesinum]|uniref:Uncharacterized protein n=1 Tax=Penicillium chermesinum TaxID=63820 RepID=A0A9W9TPD7_9EURO|nr:uncharacterized protein N7468_005120 [Penicillium chermesinum]KAJ5232164.1 hypothetical protein N7468_005120 [Penicillium chermesinum]
MGEVASYTFNCWISAIQNDFAARMRWTLTPAYQVANHPSSVKILNGTTVKSSFGASVLLSGTVQDPDQNEIPSSWWQYAQGSA